MGALKKQWTHFSELSEVIISNILYLAISLLVRLYVLLISSGGSACEVVSVATRKFQL
jgi:hypothetical protein